MSDNLLDLEMELRSIAPQVLYPPAPPFAQATRARLTASPAWHRLNWLRTVAVVLALVVIVVAAFPGARRAVASWLGLGGIRIVLVEAPVLADAAPLPATLGRPVTIDEAREAVGFELLLPTAGLGTPEVFLSEAVPGGMVSLLYPARDGNGPGLLITEFAGGTDRQLVTKDVGPGTTVTPVEVGIGGFWIEGDPHTVLFEDQTGDIRADEPRLAGNTLIWVDGGVTFRLESGGDLEQALEIADSMR